MAKWGTFKWSDGTKWVDAFGVPLKHVAFVDIKYYRLSCVFRYTGVGKPGALSSVIIHSISLETAVESQLPRRWEAIVDVNRNTQRISVKVHFNDENLGTDPFTIDKIHMLANQRSRSQPTG